MKNRRDWWENGVYSFKNGLITLKIHKYALDVPVTGQISKQYFKMPRFGADEQGQYFKFDYDYNTYYKI